MTAVKVEEAIRAAVSLGFTRVPGSDRYVRCQATKGELACRSLVIVAAPYYVTQVQAHARWHAKGYGFGDCDRCRRGDHQGCRHLEWAQSGRVCLCGCHPERVVAPA